MTWSSSSSSYARQEWFEYNTASYEYKYATEIPFQSTIGQPLIYYAQVKESTSRKQKQPEEGKRFPNCFVKAFRWYTQERHPPENTKHTNVDLSGFSIWLDNKYQQYVQEMQLNDKSSPSIIKNTSTAVTGINIRPWKKFRGFNRKIEVQQVRSCHSMSQMKFIMKPKDLNCSLSRCCTSYTSCSCKTSSIYYSKPRVIRKLRTKTQSLTNLPSRKESNRTIVAVKAIDNDIEYSKERVIATNNYEKPDQYIKRTTEETECQCPIEITLKVNADTQYELLNNTGPETLEDNKVQTNNIEQNKSIRTLRKQTKDRVDSCDCLKIIEEDAKIQRFKKIHAEPENVCGCKTLEDSKVQTNNVEQNKSIRTLRKQTKERVDSCDCLKNIEEDEKIQRFKNIHAEPENVCDCKIRKIKKKVVRKKKSNRNSIAQDNVRQSIIGLIENQKIPTEIDNLASKNVTSSQTSDYAININDHPYPLFVKIVRVDKLK